MKSLWIVGISLGVLVVCSGAYGATNSFVDKEYTRGYAEGRASVDDKYLSGWGAGLREGARGVRAEIAARSPCDKVFDLSQDVRSRENSTPEAVAYFARCDNLDTPLCQELVRPRRTTPEWRLHSETLAVLRNNCPTQYKREYP